MVVSNVVIFLMRYGSSFSNRITTIILIINCNLHPKSQRSVTVKSRNIDVKIPPANLVGYLLGSVKSI